MDLAFWLLFNPRGGLGKPISGSYPLLPPLASGNWLFVRTYHELARLPVSTMNRVEIGEF